EEGTRPPSRETQGREGSAASEAVCKKGLPPSPMKGRPCTTNDRLSGPTNCVVALRLDAVNKVRSFPLRNSYLDPFHGGNRPLARSWNALSRRNPLWRGEQCESPLTTTPS